MAMEQDDEDVFGHLVSPPNTHCRALPSGTTVFVRDVGTSNV